MAPAFPGEHHHVADAAAAARMVPELLRAGDVVLVKASHGVGLRRVCEALAGAHGARTPA
jgi:UDP-N-acetylmuramoyl-tripeptide--D-alanyl-D-alanine ligase